MAYRYKAIKVNGKKVDEHRYIMEQHIGRKLGFNEVVHHKDNNPRNNVLSNLQIMPRKKHTSDHWKTGEYVCNKENTEARTEARRQLALKIGIPVMICDLNGKELMSVRSVRLASMITGVPKTTIFEVVNGCRNLSTGSFIFLRLTPLSFKLQSRRLILSKKAS